MKKQNIFYNDFRVETSRCGEEKYVKVTHLPSSETLLLDISGKSFDETVVADILIHLITQKLINLTTN